MFVKTQIEVNAPIDAVWAVVAHDFFGADKWAASLDLSQARTDVGPGPSGSGLVSNGRACATTLGDVSETITHYDEAAKTLSYSAVAPSMPFFVKGLKNTWTLTPKGKGKTTVGTNIEVALMRIIGDMMSPMMKMQMGKLMRETMEELKFYIEEGKPHPRKVRAIQKAKQKGLKKAA